MKTYTKFFAASLFILYGIFTSAESSAFENLEVITNDNSRVMRMEVIKPSTEVIDLYLLNKRNKTIYEERINPGSTFENQIDFTHVKDGTYTLVSEMANIRFNRIIEIKDTNVELKESFYTFTPVFKIQDGYLLVHYINNSKDDIGINIENFSGFKYTKESLGDEMIYSDAFSIANLDYGFYTVYFTSGQEVFTYYFEID